MSDFPTLETPRLRLREITTTDAEELFAIHGDSERMRWFGSDPLPHIESAEKLVETFASWRAMVNPGTRWGIEIKGQPGLLGTCGLFSWNRNWKKCTVGYELSREAEGRGFMREALESVIHWGWSHMQLNRVEAQVHPENRASIALLERLGFVQEGRLRQVGFWGGSHHDMLQYSLLKQEWASRVAGAA
jgi:ribosomal-protein-alanine N-acetyltransferase